MHDVGSPCCWKGRLIHDEQFSNEDLATKAMRMRGGF